MRSPLVKLLGKGDLELMPGLKGFRQEYIDHLEFRLDEDSARAARRLLLRAARALCFLEATGLRPVEPTGERLRDLGLPSGIRRLSWAVLLEERATGHWVVFLEPLTRPAPGCHSGGAWSWLDGSGLEVAELAWPGLRAAKGSVPLLAGRDGAFLASVATTVSGLRPRFSIDGWLYPTAVYADDFVSPSRVATGKGRAPRPLGFLLEQKWS
jgi:hypothetical protein